MLLGSAPYQEVAPLLVLMAFLQRVVNGGGTIEWEYAIGKGRMDLRVAYGPDTLAIEVKTWRDGDKQKSPVSTGLEQFDGYLSALGLDTDWLVIFDQRRGQAPIAKRTHTEERNTLGGRKVTVVWG